MTGAWHKTKKVKTEEKKENIELTEADKKALLKLARNSLIYFLENKKAPNPSDVGVELTEPMKQWRAAFVTLTKHGQLRGCIGDIMPRRALYESVISNAINASVNDRRFKPVTREECDELELEISALTVPKTVASANDIRIGTDGVVLKKGARSAVFLPQVAPEQGWGLEETLTRLSLKAGLAADAWKEGARFDVFQAEVFGENK